jgi:hypothetical protein
VPLCDALQQSPPRRLPSSVAACRRARAPSFIKLARRSNRCSRWPCPHAASPSAEAGITPSCRLPAGVWREPPPRVLPPDLYTSVVSKPTRAIPGLPPRPRPSASTRALLLTPLYSFCRCRSLQPLVLAVCVAAEQAKP